MRHLGCSPVPSLPTSAPSCLWTFFQPNTLCAVKASSSGPGGILSGAFVGMLPGVHLITLSALASTFGGIVRPICLAVFRLMISSNFVGCSTGRSAGLAPLRILST